MSKNASNTEESVPDNTVSTFGTCALDSTTVESTGFENSSERNNSTDFGCEFGSEEYLSVESPMDVTDASETSWVDSPMDLSDNCNAEKLIEISSRLDTNESVDSFWRTNSPAQLEISDGNSSPSYIPEGYYFGEHPGPEWYKSEYDR